MDGQDVPRDSVLEADLCIVGGGAAGITIARELTGGPLSVILLESGGEQGDAETQALYAGENVGEPIPGGIGGAATLDEIRLRFLGGSTNHWAGHCRPLDPVDLEVRAHVPHSGWPLTRADLDPFYFRAQDVCLLGAPTYDWAYWQNEAGLGAPLIDTPAVATRTLQVTNPTKFGEVYGDQLAGAANVRLVLHANVVNLATDTAGTHLEAVDVATLDGNRWQVRARAFVLATGGIEVPRLLLASNQVRPDGLGNDHDLVGRYFMDHISVFGGFLVTEVPLSELRAHEPAPIPTLQPVTPAGHALSVMATLTLTREAQLTEELLSLQTSLAFTDIGLSGPTQVSGIDRAAIAALVGAVGATEPVALGGLYVLAEQSPNPKSRVTLAAERDALGVPRAQLDWQLQDVDRDSIRRGVELIAREVGALGLGRVQVGVGGITLMIAPPDSGALGIYAVDPAHFDDTDYSLGVGSHHMGTARMHPDPAEGVVDVDCRVHTVDNLYVAGSAVFPTGGSAPPTLTIVSLALRLADHLRDQVLA
jgi:choline dehydrogenase-like flavoprotein